MKPERVLVLVAIPFPTPESNAWVYETKFETHQSQWSDRRIEQIGVEWFAWTVDSPNIHYVDFDQDCYD